MTTTPDIKVGDEVRVYFNSRTAGQLGEVVRIGRTRLTVRVNGRNEDFWLLPLAGSYYCSVEDE